MKDKKITLDIEQLEERIAPGIAPGLDLAQGFSEAFGKAFIVSGSSPARMGWFGLASGQFTC